MVPNQQQVEFRELGEEKLPAILELAEPPFLLKGEALRQLLYIDDFVRKLGCRSLLVENHYIDRHYMEDYSVFYSRNLYPFQNFCRRLNFFACGKEELLAGLGDLRNSARTLTKAERRDKHEEFSRRCYLGFSIIKPLPGSPVGRTVLRPYPEKADRRVHRQFPSLREYTVHLGGLALTVRGLAFQQQDVGVSACATTALWSSLQKFQDLEDISSATPAQITMLASQYTLPFGRAMPSEALSLDQMCQAVRALGVSPNLFSFVNFGTARSYLYSAIASETAPVLILSDPHSEDYHAVVAVGMDVRTTHKASLSAGQIDDQAADLMGLYLHDDRIGPYISTQVRRSRKGLLSLQLPDRTWNLSHILIPMHAKIRLSFSGLRNVAVRLSETAQAFRGAVFGQSDPILFDLRISRSPLYLEHLLTPEAGSEARLAEKLWETIPLPRYVGIVRLTASNLDPIDFIVDCTSTERNLHPLALLALRTESAETSFLLRGLAEIYRCSLIE